VQNGDRTYYATVDDLLCSDRVKTSSSDRHHRSFHHTSVGDADVKSIESNRMNQSSWVEGGSFPQTETKAVPPVTRPWTK
jgi:hypothetical protein